MVNLVLLDSRVAPVLRVILVAPVPREVRVFKDRAEKPVNQVFQEKRDPLDQSEKMVFLVTRVVRENPDQPVPPVSQVPVVPQVWLEAPVPLVPRVTLESLVLLV